MLIAAGPGVTSLIDYTPFIPYDSINIDSVQGSQLDTLQCLILDQLSQFPIIAEDDIVALDETDTNGWPCVNLAANPNFSGTYSGGVAPSWSANATPSGSTYAANNTTAKYGTPSQSITIANVTNGSQVGVTQWVKLPLSETATPIVSIPYCLSFWVCPTTAFAGIGGSVVKIDWYTAVSGSFISNSITVIDSTLQGTSKSWQRVSVTATPPANAGAASIKVIVTANSNTNSGTVLIDGAQFEPVTFHAYNGIGFQPAQNNPTMAYHGTGNIVDAWNESGTSGVTWSISTTTTLTGQAQQLALSSPATNSFYQIDTRIIVNPNTNYTITMKYQATATLTNGAAARIGANCLDTAGGYISTVPDTENAFPPVGIWMVATVRVGPNTANPMPSNTAQLDIYAGMTTNATSGATGTLVIGAVTITADPMLSQPQNAVTTVQAAGIYPTPYTDNSQPGCYTDTISGCSYRQARFFGGYIRQLTADYSTGPEAWYTVQANDYGVLLAEAPATLIINQQPDNAAIALAVQYAQNQGFLVGLDYTTFVANIITVDAMVFSWQTTKDVLTKIADMSVASVWVDYYKRLHYQPALAVTAPFNVSSSPDFFSTFPFSGWQYNIDSTQTRTAPVVEGSTQISAPTTQTFTGSTTTLSAGLTSGSTYTSLSVVALTNPITAGWTVLIGGSQFVTVTANAATSATTILVASFQASSTFAIGATVEVNGVIANNGQPIAQVDLCTVGGTAQVVGLANINSFAQGYDVLFATDTALFTFNAPPSNGTAVVIVYRYPAPVIVRLHAPSATRKIHNYTKQQEIASINAAIARANSDLSQYQKARPIGQLTCYSPPCPRTTLLHPATAIAITHPPSKLSNTLFQIQEVTTTVVGAGMIRWDLKVGFYQPDFAIFMIQAAQRLSGLTTSQQADTVLNDVLSAQDGWAMTDSAPTHTVTNPGRWGNAGSKWGGTTVWE